jgi:5-methylcytosine-specific restriction endonuclease McrA
MNHASRNKRNRKLYLLNQQGGCCAYCGGRLSPRTATLDHVVPKSQGGPATRENQVAACLRCNRLKADGSAHKLVAMLMQGLVA